jgi:DNA-binding response OmpR family regulator
VVAFTGPIMPEVRTSSAEPAEFRPDRIYALSKMSDHVLFVEDDASIREITALGLTRAGFRVTTAPDGNEGLARARRDAFDLFLLDVMLPGMNGFDLCREVRRTSGVPIVLLTARTDPIDVVVGLESGADDYVRKPYEIHELAARLRAVLRRAAAPPLEKAFAVSPLVVDPGSFTVHKHGRELALTATEFRLLAELARRPGQVFTRELLLERVWGYDRLGDSRLVDVAVQRLRAKVEDDPTRPRLIRTIRGVGYKLVPDPSADR